MKIVDDLVPTSKSAAHSVSGGLGERVVWSLYNFAAMLPLSLATAGFTIFAVLGVADHYSTSGPDAENLGIIVGGVLLLCGALSIAWAEKNLDSELGYQYNTMAGLFSQAALRMTRELEHLDELHSRIKATAQGSPERQAAQAEFDAAIRQVQQFLYALGKEALDENAEWLILHRARPLEPVMAGEWRAWYTLASRQPGEKLTTMSQLTATPLSAYFSLSWNARDTLLNVNIWERLARDCHLLIDRPEEAHGGKRPYFICRIETLMRRSDVFVCCLPALPPERRTSRDPAAVGDWRYNEYSPFILFELRLAERADLPRFVLYDRESRFQPPSHQPASWFAMSLAGSGNFGNCFRVADRTANWRKNSNNGFRGSSGIIVRDFHWSRTELPFSSPTQTRRCLTRLGLEAVMKADSSVLWRCRRVSIRMPNCFKRFARLICW